MALSSLCFAVLGCPNLEHGMGFRLLSLVFTLEFELLLMKDVATHKIALAFLVSALKSKSLSLTVPS